jgi:O-methyltransferase involved in polyketide biosynthesis
LDVIRHRNIHYIDTDLPEVITQKAKLISIIGKDLDTIGDLELLQLNVLDKKQFTEIISHFPAGEIIIVNEGLLMYLNRAEKEILSGIIYNILKERQGYWIVADIYVKNRKQRHHLKIGSKLKEYYAQQNIEDNKFESFEDAEQFFNNMGFVIDRVARIKPWTLSSWRYLLRSLTFRQFLQFFKIKKMRATWRLRLSNN